MTSFLKELHQCIYRNHFPSSLTVTLDEMQEMILENVRKESGWSGVNCESACDAAVEYYGMEPSGD